MPPLERDEHVDGDQQPGVEVSDDIQVVEGDERLGPAATERSDGFTDAYWSGVRAGWDQSAEKHRQDAWLAIRQTRRLAAAAAVGALVLGVICGAVAFPRERTTSTGGRQSVPTDASAGSPGPECRKALSQATTALGAAVRIERALADHSRVMDQLSKRSITTSQALAMGRESLARGSTASAALDAAMGDYLQTMKACNPERP